MFKINVVHPFKCFFFLINIQTVRETYYFFAIQATAAPPISGIFRGFRPLLASSFHFPSYRTRVKTLSRLKILYKENNIFDFLK